MKRLPLFDPPVERVPLASIHREVQTCTLCPLCQSRGQTVFGQGATDARLFLLGEAPGELEDLSGNILVGSLGELLSGLLKDIGIDIETVYIANTVKCRPPRNRKPYPDEILACKFHLERQIHSVRPRIIVALGAFAASWLLGEIGSISLIRGQIWYWEDYPVVATYHPAYLLRQPEDRKKVLNDLQLAKEIL